LVTYTTATILTLASQCAPNVSPQTVAAIVHSESRGRPWALNVNGTQQPGRQRSASMAAATAQRYVAAGYSVDLGLGQINSRNMRRLGLTWETVFDPCTNIAALGRVLSDNYRAVADGRHPQTALRLALSLYNTGSTSRGFRNGYVAKVVGNAGTTDATAAQPSNNPLTVVAASEDRSPIAIENGPAWELETRDRPPPAWNVFERAAYARTAPAPPTTEKGTLLWTR
jgi:type IV secretion system protein VirB1